MGENRKRRSGPISPYLSRAVAKSPQRPGNMRQLNYLDFMNTEEWQQIRELVLARAHNKCEDCGADGPLDVHHKTYRNFGGKEQLSDLVAVCRPCHERRGRIRKQIRRR